MIGFVTTSQKAAGILKGIKNAQEGRGKAHYWTTGAYPIYTGEHAGKTFIPFDDTMKNTNLRNGLKPADFPEFPQLLNALGGLNARVDLDPQAIIDPNAETFSTP